MRKGLIYFPSAAILVSVLDFFSDGLASHVMEFPDKAFVIENGDFLVKRISWDVIFDVHHFSPTRCVDRLINFRTDIETIMPVGRSTVVLLGLHTMAYGEKRKWPGMIFLRGESRSRK